MKTKHLMLACLLAACQAFSASTAHAQTVWDGGASTINWGDASNWNPDGVPTAATSVSLDSAAPSTINLQNTNRPVGTLTFAANATTSITLNNTGTSGLISLAQGHSIVVLGSSANHSIARVSTTRQTTVNVAGGALLTHTFQILGSDLAGANQNVFTKSGNGTLRLSGVQNFGDPRGLISVTAGTLDIRGALGVAGTSAQNHTQLLSGSPGAILTNGGALVTLAFGRNSGRTTPDAGNQTFAGSITGNISFQLGHTSTLAGTQPTNFTGTQTLSGNNSYIGTTVVNQGTLIISGTSTGQGNYTVRGTTTSGSAAKTGTLAGNGTIGLASGANFTVGSTSHVTGSQGVLYAGANSTDTSTMTIGTAGNSNTVSIIDGGVLRLDIAGVSNSDALAVIGNLTLGANSTLSLNPLLGAWDGGVYTIATWTGTRTGTFGTVTGLGSGYVVSYNLNSVTLIPEPTTMAMLGFCAVLCVLLRRKRAAV